MSKIFRRNTAAACAAVMMLAAVAAVPASASEVVTVGAGTPTIEIGQVFVTAGEEEATMIAPVITNAVATEGMSLAFKEGDAAAPATAAFLAECTYVTMESSIEFSQLGAWQPNPEKFIWAIATSGQKIDPVADGTVPVEMYYDIPDEATVKEIAAQYNMKAQTTEDGAYYYEFAFEFDHEKINSSGGNALLWAGENATALAAEYIDGSICVIVTEPNPEPDYLLGDVNNDGAVTVEDAVAVLTYYAQQSAGLTPDTSNFIVAAADVDGNGAVAVEDAVKILAYYAQQSAGLTPSWD